MLGAPTGNGQVLISDGVGGAAWGSNIFAGNLVEITTSGTWTKPEGVTRLRVTLVPGGSTGQDHIAIVPTYDIFDQPTAATDYGITVGAGSSGLGGESRITTPENAGGTLRGRQTIGDSYSNVLSTGVHSHPNANIISINRFFGLSGNAAPWYDRAGNPRGRIGSSPAVSGIVIIEY